MGDGASMQAQAGPETARPPVVCIWTNWRGPPRPCPDSFPRRAGRRTRGGACMYMYMHTRHAHTPCIVSMHSVVAVSGRRAPATATLPSGSPRPPPAPAPVLPVGAGETGDGRRETGDGRKRRPRPPSAAAARAPSPGSRRARLLAGPRCQGAVHTIPARRHRWPADSVAGAGGGGRAYTAAAMQPRIPLASKTLGPAAPSCTGEQRPWLASAAQAYQKCTGAALAGVRCPSVPEVCRGGLGRRAPRNRPAPLPGALRQRAGHQEARSSPGGLFLARRANAWSTGVVGTATSLASAASWPVPGTCSCMA